MFYFVFFSLLILFVTFFICSLYVCTTCIHAISRDSHWYRNTHTHTGSMMYETGFSVFFFHSLSLLSENILSPWLLRLPRSLSFLVESNYVYLSVFIYSPTSYIKHQIESICSICAVQSMWETEAWLCSHSSFSLFLSLNSRLSTNQSNNVAIDRFLNCILCPMLIHYIRQVSKFGNFHNQYSRIVATFNV